MKKILGVCVSLFLLSACTQSVTTSVPSTPVAKEKAVDTTLTGTITKTGGKFYINSTGQATKELDSYTVKLDDYVGKKVSVTGQYSGITLFVDTVTSQ
jgi:hypothetical protein